MIVDYAVKLTRNWVSSLALNNSLGRMCFYFKINLEQRDSTLLCHRNSPILSIDISQSKFGLKSIIVIS